jgi:transposase InsO family protein
MDGTIEYINRKAVTVFGHLPEDIPTMERWWVQAYPDETYRKYVAADWTGRIQKGLAEEGQIAGNEYRIACKDGSVKTIVTLKYRPDFPPRFGSEEHARAHCRDFFPWYNNEHRHSGIGFFTAHDVHYGLAGAKQASRAKVMQAAFYQHPERFPHGMPKPSPLPHAVWINVSVRRSPS